jgi:hypothetical protein
MPIPRLPTDRDQGSLVRVSSGAAQTEGHDGEDVGRSEVLLGGM